MYCRFCYRPVNALRGMGKIALLMSFYGTLDNIASMQTNRRTPAMRSLPSGIQTI